MDNNIAFSSGALQYSTPGRCVVSLNNHDVICLAGPGDGEVNENEI